MATMAAPSEDEMCSIEVSDGPRRKKTFSVSATLLYTRAKGFYNTLPTDRNKKTTIDDLTIEEFEAFLDWIKIYGWGGPVSEEQKYLRKQDGEGRSTFWLAKRTKYSVEPDYETMLSLYLFGTKYNLNRLRWTIWSRLKYFFAFRGDEAGVCVPSAAFVKRAYAGTKHKDDIRSLVLNAFTKNCGLDGLARGKFREFMLKYPKEFLFDIMAHRYREDREYAVHEEDYDSIDFFTSEEDEVDSE